MWNSEVTQFCPSHHARGGLGLPSQPRDCRDPYATSDTACELPDWDACNLLASLVAQLVKNPPVMQETPIRFLGGEDLLKKGYPLQYSWASLVAQMVKYPPTLWETWVWSMGWKGPLEKRTAAYSSILAWRIPWAVRDCMQWPALQEPEGVCLFYSSILLRWRRVKINNSCSPLNPSSLTGGCYQTHSLFKRVPRED